MLLCRAEEIHPYCAMGNAGKHRLRLCVKCRLRSDVARVYCVLILMLKHLQHIWLGDRGEEKGDQHLQSHHTVSTPARFSFSQIRDRALGIVNNLKAALSVPCTLTITTSFLSSSMSLSFFPFFFPPCSDVAVGSYLSLPACKGRFSIIRNILQSNSTAADMNYTHTRLPGRQSYYSLLKLST